MDVVGVPVADGLAWIVISNIKFPESRRKG